MKPSLNLNDLLVNAEQNNFTGKVLVKSQNAVQWQLYFLLGKVIWINGGYHAHRSWLRKLVKFCPEINCEDLGSATKNYYECPQYQTLYLLASKNLINKEKVKLILELRIEEKFFDILQEQEKSQVTYNLKQDTPSNILNYGFKPSLVIIDYHNILHKAQEQIMFFAKSSLKDISLNYAPKIFDNQKLHKKVKLETYSHFVHFFDGNLSLRDLSLRLNKNVVKLALSLVSFINQGIIKLEAISDVNNNINVQQYAFTILKYKRLATKFTIACIDDNEQFHDSMNIIISKLSGRYVEIKDEFKAITSLVECNPDLIFINVAMPVVNGYELCSQIKRVPQLNQIPIILLSDNKSLTDRMRSKLVGASDFITKPLGEKYITKILDKLTSDSTNPQPESSSILAVS